MLYKYSLYALLKNTFDTRFLMLYTDTDTFVTYLFVENMTN